MRTRHVLMATNDSSDPPSTIHLVYGAESSWRVMAQEGSRDYLGDADGLRWLAEVLTRHGYLLTPDSQTDAIMMSRDLFDSMSLDVLMLRRLEAAGVDGWDGYGAALAGMDGSDG